MKYTIYLRTNKINGMQYVGQTKDFELREKQFNRINQRYANKILTEDRREFGLDSFNVEILAEVETQEESWALEKTYIKAYNTKYPNGYNMSDGGETSKGTKHTKESIKNMSEAVKKYWGSNDSPWKGIPKTLEARKRQSETIKKYYREHPEAIIEAKERGKKLVGDKNPFYGKHHTEEYKHAKSEQSKGKHYSRATEFPSKTVYKYDLNEKLLATYPSTSECARQNNVSQGAISYAINVSKTHICKGYIYSFELL